MATASLKKKSNLFNEANEILYDNVESSSEVTFVVPWPEWNDAELNSEIWEESKTKPPTKSALSLTSSLFFEDPNPPQLPFAIKDRVCSWKRPQEIFTEANLTVYNPSNVEFQLILSSAVADCDFFTKFNELLPILQFYALKYGFPVELETPTFVFNAQGECWRPWHHIYSLCKAGKGQFHKPLYNPYGKYVLRIFYMGFWRKFVVDDKIPCDKLGNCMLPVTQVQGELWPILLSKGFLKIISLIPTIEFSSNDFSLLPLLTGWINGRISVKNKTAEQVWRRLYCAIPHNELPKEESASKTSVTSLKDYTSKKVSSKKNLAEDLDKKCAQQFNDFCFVLATLGVSQEKNLLKNHTIGLIMVRDLSLTKANKRENTEAWKRIRWVYWASEKGVWTDELKLSPFRSVQFITFTKELKKLLEPDLKQDAIIFDIPSNDQLGFNDQFSTAENKLFEPEQWSDFFTLHKYLIALNFLIKPSAFVSNFKVTCLRPEAFKKPMEKSTATKTAENPLPPLNLYFQSLNINTTCNEPPILLCESLTGIFLCISLWVCKKSVNESVRYLESHPYSLTLSHASLIIERYDWRTTVQGEIIGKVETVGNASIGLNLNSGRHILKLWLNSDFSYIIDIYSNVELIVHKGAKIRFLMSNESERILSYINNVSNAFINLTQKFGKSEFSLALSDFYKTINPGNEMMIGYRSKIDEFIETFLNCILLALKNLIPTVEELKISIYALQSLFVNPKIQLNLPQKSLPYISRPGKNLTKKIVPVVKERTLSEILNYPRTSEEINKIISIQKVFRGFRIRLLWKNQNPVRKEFKIYNDCLKKVGDLIFAPAKREIEVGSLIRMVMRTNPEFLTTFRFYEDFKNVIDVKEYNGKIVSVEPFSWVPVTRFIIACHSHVPIPCSFYFSSNLQHFVIQGFNNDTNEELFRLTNSVSPHYYQNNVNGYTILVFGWNEANTKTINWRLEMIKEKHFQVLHLCNTLLNLTCNPYTIPNPEILEVKNFFVPNHRSRICRCLIKIKKRTLLTLRFSLSYSNVQFVVIISVDEKFSDTDLKTSDKIIAKSQGINGAVILNSLILEHVESSFSLGESATEESFTLYTLEAYVINNSWPLTKHEWGIVELIRVNGENWKGSSNSLHLKKGLSESRKKLTRTSKRNLNEQKQVENPFWLLQVWKDFSEGLESDSSIIVEEDRSYTDSVKAMKISWEEKNPGRRKKGQELRSKFLRMMYLENFKNQALEVEDISEETKGGNSKENEYPKDLEFLLDKINSFSYLTNDKSPTRYYKSPRILPQMPTYELLYRYKKRTENSIEISEDSITKDDKSDISSNSLKNMLYEEEEKKNFLNQRLYFRLLMMNHLAEEQKLSSQLMKQAYENRLKVIERLAR